MIRVSVDPMIRVSVDHKGRHTLGDKLREHEVGTEMLQRQFFSCALLLPTLPNSPRHNIEIKQNPLRVHQLAYCSCNMRRMRTPLDCEQSFFSPKIRGEERKQVGSRERASVICEAASSKMPAILAPRGIASRTSRSQLTVTCARSLALRSSPQVFEEKRDSSQSACPQERADHKS